jgi:succinate dehydrogenase / fumarate reductase cytochrome b subunit
MNRHPSFTGTSVGKKILMAVTGVLLFGFLLGHMAGNLKVYQGPVAFDAYAHHLRTFGEGFLDQGQFLWIARITLLFALGVHMFAAARLIRVSRQARRQGYRKSNSLSFTYASKTMRLGGLWILLYLLFHLADLTIGTSNPGFVEGQAYANLIRSFSRPPIAIFYIVSMIPLGMHLYHGLWSATQTLGLANERVRRLRRPLVTIATVGIMLGFISIPISVLAGILK